MDSERVGNHGKPLIDRVSAPEMCRQDVSAGDDSRTTVCEGLAGSPHSASGK